MANCPKASFIPALFGIVIALSSVLVVKAVSQHALASASFDTGFPDAGSRNTGSFNSGSISSFLEVGNTTMAGATNQTTTNGNATDVQFLSIQTAQSGSLYQINATAYTLELNNVANETILFSDRPNRIVTSISTVDFVGNWTTGPNSFS